MRNPARLIEGCEGLDPDRKPAKSSIELCCREGEIIAENLVLNCEKTTAQEFLERIINFRGIQGARQLFRQKERFQFTDGGSLGTEGIILRRKEG